MQLVPKFYFIWNVNNYANGDVIVYAIGYDIGCAIRFTIGYIIGSISDQTLNRNISVS